jgi:1,4-dihydroxy-2-naphthoate octaprenyltransferase
MGVLNLNNMRDIDNDKLSGKNTIASRLGLQKAKIYHLILILLGILSGVAYVILHYQSPFNLLFVVAVILLIRDLVEVLKQQEQQKLDPYLKRLALGTFLFTLLFGVGLLI